MSIYDWSKVPDEIKWIATDNIDGNFISWGYPEKPRKMIGVWGLRNSIFIGVGLFKGNWQDSLEERPK